MRVAVVFISFLLCQFIGTSLLENLGGTLQNAYQW
jgi:hypothetical protein